MAIAEIAELNPQFPVLFITQEKTPGRSASRRFFEQLGMAVPHSKSVMRLILKGSSLV